MSHTTYAIQGSTADDEYFLPSDMSTQYKECFVSFAFYTDSTQKTVAPVTAGTAIVMASEGDSTYGNITNGTVDFSQASYVRPNCAGLVKKMKVELSGVVGASYFVATIARYGG